MVFSVILPIAVVSISENPFIAFSDLKIFHFKIKSLTIFLSFNLLQFHVHHPINFHFFSALFRFELGRGGLKQK